MSSAVYLWKTFRAQAEQHSGVSQKVFGFSPESMFAFARNAVRNQPGILFGFTPECCSPCPGIRTVVGKHSRFMQIQFSDHTP